MHQIRLSEDHGQCRWFLLGATKSNLQFFFEQILSMDYLDLPKKIIKIKR